MRKSLHSIPISATLFRAGRKSRACCPCQDTLALTFFDPEWTSDANHTASDDSLAQPSNCHEQGIVYSSQE